MTALALMRLLPENGRVTDGRVAARRRTTCSRCPSRGMRAVRGGRIGMIFQEPATSLNPVMTVGDADRRGDRAPHRAARRGGARARRSSGCGAVGIPEPERRIDDYPFRMSRRPEAARDDRDRRSPAEPDFLIADEPTTALDVTIQAQILDLLKELQTRAAAWRCC